MQLYYPPEMGDLVEPWLGELDPVVSSGRPTHCTGFYLWWGDGRLVLYRGSDPHGVCLQPELFERRANLRGELARACGVTAVHKPRVLDVMAGLGVDGMTLRELGCAVVMIERHPALWAMLDSFVGMWTRHQPADRQVILADGWGWLEASAAARAAFDVIYLDPMFPARRKGALPGKAMQFLAELTQADEHPLADWIDHCRHYTTGRVVLKRRLRDPRVHEPDWQVAGRSVRYDVYRGDQDQVPRNTA